MENNTTKNSSKAYVIEILLFTAYAFFGVNWIAATNMSPEILETFGIHGGSTAIQNAVTIARIVGNFVAATILNKLYPKKSIGLGALLIALGSYITALAPAFWMLVVGRAIFGLGGALLVVYMAPVVLEYFTADKRPTINAINGLAFNIGGILVLLLLEPVYAWLNTSRKTLLFFATISLVLFILWMIFGEDFELADDPSASEMYTLKDAASTKIGKVMPLMYFGHLLLYMVMLNLFPTTSLSAIPASRVSLLFTIGGIIGSVIAVYVAKKSKKRVPVLKITGIIFPILAFALVNVNSPTLTSIIALTLGTVMYVPLTNLVTIPQELPGMSKGLITQIMSFFWAGVYAIETIAFYIVGNVVRTNFGDKAAIYLAIALSFSFFIGSFFIPEPTETTEKMGHAAHY